MANGDVLKTAPVTTNEDVSNEYMTARVDKGIATDSQEMIDWVMSQRVAKSPKQADPFPPRKPPAESSTVGNVARNVGEIPKGMALGADSAVRNATDWAIGPLVDWLNDNVANLEIPVEAPTTGTGQITKSVTEFVAGFIPAMKTMKLMGVAGKVAQPLTASALADFAVRDPHEARLSNLWKEAGLPKNVLTEYLAADPSDTEIEGRFKSAAESVFTGTVLEGLVLGARALRAAKSVQAVKEAEDAALIARYGELTEKDFDRVIGDPSKPVIETRVRAPSAAGKKVEKGMEATEGVRPEEFGRSAIAVGDSEVYINFNRIGGAEDVKAVISNMAGRFKGSIDEARRGVITHAETEKMADELGMTVTDLLRRRRGQPLNAEEAVAARKLWQASGEALLNAAKKASDPNAGPLDQYAFRKAMSVHHAIQAEVVGARTETARALASWRITAEGGVERARAVDQLIQAMGGPEASQEMARRLAILAEHGDPAALAKFVERGYLAASFDAVREIWINGLLSSPATHVVNTMSNTVVAFQQILERGVASRIGALTGTQGGVQAGEAMAMTYGLLTGIKDALRLSAKAFKTGETGWALNKIDLPYKRSVSAEAFQISSETGLGRAIDLIGEAARIPGRFLGAEDEFFKTIGYRMELHAQALRQATSEGLKGRELAERMHQIVLNPPENIRIAAADAAIYNTFTNAPGNIGQAFMKLRERAPAITFVLPFVRTPVNIARYTFERTPFAPLVAQWRDDIAAGGARADLALARMGTGTMAMLVALDYADSGLVSGAGPAERGERDAMQRQGWQPYSIKVGDRWYSYNRTDPLGAMLGFAADVSEAIRRGEINEDDVDEWQEVMAMGITAVSQVAVNKTYLRGLSEFVEVMSDPQRYGEHYVNNMVSSFVPYTALSGAIARSADPVRRETTNPWEAIQARVAGLSGNLPPRRNLWGEEIRSESGLGKAYDFFSPVYSREVTPSPIDTEIMRLAPMAAMDNVEGAAPTRIGKRTSFQGVRVNFKEWPEVYDEYVRLAGNDLKHPAFKMGAKDLLNAIVTGKHPLSKVYEIRSDPMKIVFIKQVISQYRELAQQEILNDRRHQDFADYVGSLQATKRESRLPVVPQ